MPHKFHLYLFQTFVFQIPTAQHLCWTVAICNLNFHNTYTQICTQNFDNLLQITENWRKGDRIQTQSGEWTDVFEHQETDRKLYLGYDKTKCRHFLFDDVMVVYWSFPEAMAQLEVSFYLSQWGSEYRTNV